MTDTKSKKLSLVEQVKLDSRLIEAARKGNTETVSRLLAGGANVHALDDWALDGAAKPGYTETVKVLLAYGADVHADDDNALCGAAHWGHMETVRVLARHIFAADSWRGKSRTEIEAYAAGLYDKIKTELPAPQPERLNMAATILADCAIDCWHQVRPPPPKIHISPLPAQPRPL